MSSADESPAPSLKKRKKNLESRLERMEKAMSKVGICTFRLVIFTSLYATIFKLCPDSEIEKELGDRPTDNEPTHALTPASERGRASGSRAETPLIPLARTVAPPSPAAGSADDEHSDSEEGQELDKELSEGIRKLSVHSPPLRYHGKSSGLVFIRSALALKNEVVGSPPPPKGEGQHPWIKVFVEEEFPLLDGRSFPPRDLLDALVELYFREMNTHCPLLHEPIFKKALAAGQHLRDDGFGATVLLVCAIGARFTRDPRVLLDGSEHHHSAGWRWFRVVERARRMSFAPAKIYDVQICALMALFLQGTVSPQSTWSLIGAGIRIALDVGAHRKKMYSPSPTVEEELWRRAFLILVSLEWVTSYGLGRPSSIHDEDLDIALPTECDDEYWLTPEGEPSFKQPPGKPSKITAFVCVLKLGQILSFAMRTISDEQWEQRLVADLDSALNKWTDALPSHLRWNPEQENALWLTQAASLRAFHFYTQFAVHRPFTVASRRESSLSFPSVIMCTNGARSSIQVLEVLYKRTGTPCHRNMGMLFMSGIILMTNILGLKRMGRVVNSGRDLASVEKAIEMLHALRYEMHIAESLGELLNELVCAIKGPLSPKASIPQDAHAQDRATTTTITTAAAKAPATSREPIPSDAGDNPSTAPSSSPVTSAHPGPTLQIPPGFEFLQSYAFNFTLPLRTGPDGLQGLPSLAQGFAVPMGGPASGVQHNPLDPLPGFLLPVRQDPSSNNDGAQHGVGHNQFAMPMGGQIFGLEPLGYGYGGPTSFLPSAAASQPEVGANNYTTPAPHHTLANAPTPETEMTLVETGDQADFALIGDTAMVWSDIPPAVGWEEWGTYLEDTNNTAGT
ncbi:transcription factor [Ganoderma sinense ZZ0214-1]|uniref:Transcription factor n=1 Tax=Ganoderma sinense ZZ0214-1 TaxID=1077348 RepID=A0A2G8RVM3_9APHY|nr:transcription factor [Ganoderma sinense ZZ0214-1]